MSPESAELLKKNCTQILLKNILICDMKGMADEL